jgi:hypothetical protein
MAVETSSDRSRSSNIMTSDRPESQSGSFTTQKSGLLPGERIVSQLRATSSGTFQLTHARVIFNSDSSSDSGAVYASAQLKDITAVRISRRPRARRSAAWGVVGLFAAIGVWQVTPSSTVGITAGLAVAVISLILMANYWIRPAGVHLEFHTTGGTISGEVDEKVAVAMEFARDVEDAKRRIIPSRVSTSYRNYPSG